MLIEIVMKMIWKKLINEGLLKYIQIRTHTQNQQMHLKKLMQPWLVFLIPINAVFTIRLEVNKLLNNNNLEVEVMVTIHFKEDIITDFRAISLHQKIYLTIFFTVLKSREEAMLQCKGEDSNNNSNNIDRERKKKSLDHK